MFFGYIDYTLEDVPRPFYVGIGNESRIKRMSRGTPKCFKHKNVVNKHGQDRRVIIEFVDWMSACAWEIQNIANLNTYHYDDPAYIGCNFTRGGDGSNGFKHSDESKQQMSLAHRGKTLSESTRQKVSQSLIGNTRNLGNHASDETRKKLSESHKGLVSPNFGKQLSIEWKQKISNSLKGRSSPLKGKHLTEEQKKIVSDTFKGKRLTEEHKQKLSNAAKQREARKRLKAQEL